MTTTQPVTRPHVWGPQRPTTFLTLAITAVAIAIGGCQRTPSGKLLIAFPKSQRSYAWSFRSQ